VTVDGRRTGWATSIGLYVVRGSEVPLTGPERPALPVSRWPTSHPLAGVHRDLPIAAVSPSTTPPGAPRSELFPRPLRVGRRSSVLPTAVRFHRGRRRNRLEHDCPAPARPPYRIYLYTGPRPTPGSYSDGTSHAPTRHLSRPTEQAVLGLALFGARRCGYGRTPSCGAMAAITREYPISPRSRFWGPPACCNPRLFSLAGGTALVTGAGGERRALALGLSAEGGADCPWPAGVAGSHARIFCAVRPARSANVPPFLDIRSSCPLPLPSHAAAAMLA